MPDNENLEEVVGDEPQYEYVTDPMMLDSTGQEIKDSIDGVAATLQSLVGAISPSASNVSFDNTGTQWSASNMQALGTEIGTAIKILRTVQVTGTTSVNGNATVNLNTADYIPIHFAADNTSVMYMFGNSSANKIAIHFTDASGATLANTAISGTLYYMRIADLAKLLV